jgi:hypothetical protein
MIKSAAFLLSMFFFSNIVLAQLDGGTSNGGDERGAGGVIIRSNPVGFDGSSAADALDKYNREVKDKLHQSRPKFAKLFEQAQDAILKDDMQKADKLVIKLREMELTNDYERSRLYLIDYWYYGKQGNKELENDAAAKLLSVGAGNIDSHAFVEAGMRLLKRQYNNQDIGGAIETLTNLRKEPDAQVELMSVVSAVKKLDDYAEQKTNIVQKITTNEVGNWSAKLFKPNFLFSNVSGEINTLEFNCANKQSVLPYKADSVIQIPDAWGICKLKVNAKPNTAFNFIQLQQKPT